MATGCAGVAGGAAAAAAGFSLGYDEGSVFGERAVGSWKYMAVSVTDLVYHADNKALLFDIVGGDSLIILEDFT